MSSKATITFHGKRQGFLMLFIGIFLAVLCMYGILAEKTETDLRPLTEAEARMMDPEPDLLILGDSIIALERDNTTVADHIREITGLRVFNACIGGTTGASVNTGADSAVHQDAASLYYLQKALIQKDFGTILSENATECGGVEYEEVVFRRLQQVDLSKVKYLVLAYGTNDYFAGLMPYHREEPEDRYSYGCVLGMTVEAFRKAYPQMQVILVTPKYCVINGEECTEKSYGGGTLPDYVDAACRVGEDHNVPVIDMFYESGIDQENIMEMTGGDGLHLDAVGIDHYGRVLGEKLKEIIR